MTTRLQDNLIKGIIIAILFTILLFQSFLSAAQSNQWRSPKSYKGFVASFGTRSATLNSSIAPLHETALIQHGGKVGLVAGNDIVRAKLGLLGYYTSGGNSAGTTDLYSSNIAVNLYPLSWITKSSGMIEPYITAGLDYDQHKFYGYYLNQEPGNTNYSQAEAPYLGKIKQVNATAGLGVEVKLRDDLDFVHLFTEFRYGHNLSTKTQDSAFSGTAVTGQTQLVLGISFGSRR